MFSSSFDDARYLPFEGQDADDSIWTLRVGNPAAPKEILDMYDSLTDIQIRVSYTVIPKLQQSLTI